jgi:hypothetical protein
MNNIKVEKTNGYRASVTQTNISEKRISLAVVIDFYIMVTSAPYFSLKSLILELKNIRIFTKRSVFLDYKVLRFS